GWDDAVWIARNVFIKEDNFIRKLDDPPRRSDPRNAGPVTVEDRIELAFVVRKVLYLRLKLGLIRRRQSGRQGPGDVGPERPAATGIDPVDLDFAIDFLFQSR